MTLVVAVAAADGVAVVADGRAERLARAGDGVPVRVSTPLTKVTAVGARTLVGHAGDVALGQETLGGIEGPADPEVAAAAAGRGVVARRSEARARLVRVFGDAVPERTPLAARFVVAGLDGASRPRLFVVDETGGVRETTSVRHALIGSAFVPQHFVSTSLQRLIDAEMPLEEASSLAVALVEHVACAGFPSVLPPVRAWEIRKGRPGPEETTLRRAGARARLFARLRGRPAPLVVSSPSRDR